ncbi:MAG TPA: hypothetical protein VIM30_02290 [Candidatus Limnocylindrales bacterium]|jgi:hypothetical protein
MTTDYRQFINRDLPLVERGCTSKISFESRREAKSVSRRGGDGRLRPYHCGNCESWHLGHARQRHRLPDVVVPIGNRVKEGLSCATAPAI